MRTIGRKQPARAFRPRDPMAGNAKKRPGLPGMAARRPIGRRIFLSFCAAGLAMAAIPGPRPARGAEEETPLDRLAKLATYLSENSAPEALACFDPNMKDYATLAADINALGAQTDVLCAIDIVTEEGSGDERKLDTDWYVELRSQADDGPVERRRERVALTMRKDRGKWKITAMNPVGILEPIHIQ